METDDGTRYSARYVVMASGCLSSVNRPAFGGLDEFEGDWYHTARWPADGVELCHFHLDADKVEAALAKLAQ